MQVGPPTLYDHEGTGPNTLRQSMPHPHGIHADPNSDLIMVCSRTLPSAACSADHVIKALSIFCRTLLRQSGFLSLAFCVCPFCCLLQTPSHIVRRCMTLRTCHHVLRCRGKGSSRVLSAALVRRPVTSGPTSSISTSSSSRTVSGS